MRYAGALRFPVTYCRGSHELPQSPLKGISAITNDEPEQFAVFQPDPEAARLAIADVERHRHERDNARCAAALDELRRAAAEVSEGRAIGSVMANLVAAADADATLGEMQTVLHQVFGRNK